MYKLRNKQPGEKFMWSNDVTGLCNVFRSYNGWAEFQMREGSCWGHGAEQGHHSEHLSLATVHPTVNVWTHGLTSYYVNSTTTQSRHTKSKCLSTINYIYFFIHFLVSWVWQLMENIRDLMLLLHKWMIFHIRCQSEHFSCNSISIIEPHEWWAAAGVSPGFCPVSRVKWHSYLSFALTL